MRKENVLAALLICVLVGVTLARSFLAEPVGKLTIGQPGKPPTPEFRYPDHVYALRSGGYALVYDHIDGQDHVVVYFDTQRLRSCEIGSGDLNDPICQRTR